MNRKRKFYQASRMLRAGRALAIVRQPVMAFQIGDDGVYRPIATCNMTAITREVAGFPKEFARATAGIPLARLKLYVCAAADTEMVAGQLKLNRMAYEEIQLWFCRPKNFCLRNCGFSIDALLKAFT